MFLGKPEVNYPTTINTYLNYIIDARSDLPLQVNNDCDLSTLTLYNFYLVAGNCSTYEFKPNIIDASNVKQLNQDPRSCYLFQNIAPDVNN